jgi:hypothetical protein
LAFVPVIEVASGAMTDEQASIAVWNGYGDVYIGWQPTERAPAVSHRIGPADAREVPAQLIACADSAERLLQAADKFDRGR